MKRYVVGFMFDTQKEFVALIEKARPAWQKGKFNGIGGHIENGESPDQAVRREFLEETGVYHDQWELFAHLTCGDDAEIYFYRTFCDDIFAIRCVTDEPVAAWALRSLPQPLLPNLNWLIPMAKHEEPAGTPYTGIPYKISERLGRARI